MFPWAALRRKPGVATAQPFGFVADAPATRLGKAQRGGRGERGKAEKDACSPRGAEDGLPVEEL